MTQPSLLTHTPRHLHTMKIISLLLATAAFLAAAVAAAGFPLNAVALLSIGCAACIVGLFVHDYGRARRNHSRARVRRREGLRPTLAPARTLPGSESHRVEPTATTSGSFSRSLRLIHVSGRPNGSPEPSCSSVASVVASGPLVTLS